MFLFPIPGTAPDFSWIGTINSAGLTANLKMVLDAGDINSYSSGQKWLDTSGGGYDMFRGSTISAEGDDPTFNGVAGDLSSSEYFSTDGGDRFKYDSTPETWMDNLHKNNASYSIIIWMYHKVLENKTWFSTCGTGNRNGIFLTHGELASDNKMHLSVYHASGLSKDVTFDTDQTTDAWNFIGLSLDEAGGSTGSFAYLNGAYDQLSSSDTFDGVYASPSTSGNGPLVLMNNDYSGTGNGPIASGARFGGVMIWEGGIITKANMDTLWDAQKGRFGL